MKKRIISMIVAVIMVLGMLPVTAGAAVYNTNLFTDGEFNGTPDFKYNYLNIGNLVIYQAFEAAPGTNPAKYKQVTQYTEDNGNKYLGIKTDAAASGGTMVELTAGTYQDLLEENVLYKASMRIKVPAESIKGTTGKVMLIPKKQNGAYEPILCNKYGIPTDLYPNGNISGQQKNYTKWDGYYQTLIADEWITLETYFKVKSVGSGEKRVNIDLKGDTNRLKDWEYFIDDLRLEAVENSIELLEIKSADGNDNFEITIPKFNEPDSVSKYFAEFKVNGTEIYNDVNWSLAELKLPEGNAYRGVKIENNELVVTSEAVNSTITLIAEAADGTRVKKEVRLTAQTQVPEVRNLSVIKENGYLKADYTFYDPMGDEDNSTYQWYYMEDNTAEPILLDGANEKTLNPEESLYNKLFLVKITPKTRTSEGETVKSEIIPFLDLAPEARNVEILGIVMEGSQIRVSYEYFDVNKDEEGETEILWYMSNSRDGAFDEQIGSGKTLDLTKEYVNKYIRVCVKPVSVNAPFEGEIVSCTTEKPVGNKNLLGYGEFEGGEIVTEPKTVRVNENGTWVNKESVYSTYNYDGKKIAQNSAGLYEFDSDSHSGNQSLRYIPQTGSNIACYYAENVEFEYNTFYVATAYLKAGSEGGKGKASFHASGFRGNPSKEAEMHYSQDLFNADYASNYYYLRDFGTTYDDSAWKKIQTVFYIEEYANCPADKTTAIFTLGSQDAGNGASNEVLIDDVTLYEPGVDMEITGANEITIPVSDDEAVTEEYSLKVNLHTDGGISFTDPVKHIMIKNDTEDDGVSIENNVLTVRNNAKEGTVTLQAVRSGVTEEFNVNLKFAGSDNERTQAQCITLTKSEDAENTVTASYRYYDADGIAEGATEYQWLMSDSYGDGYSDIENAGSLSYTATDLSKYYKLKITVKNVNGRNGVYYSKPLNFGKAQPVATNVKISGKSNIDEKITLTYKLEDPSGSKELTAAIKWYRSSDGIDWQEIDGAAEAAYWPAAEDLGQYIRAGVTPSKTDLDGDEVYSNNIGPIERTAVDFIFVYGQSNSADTPFKGEKNENAYLPPEHTLYTWQYPRSVSGNTYSWNGNGLAKITDDDGNDLGEWAEVNDVRMFGVPLCTRWSELSGNKVVYFNAGIPGAAFGDLGKGQRGYNAAVAGIKKAFEEIEARGYTINKKLMFWLQGESNAGGTLSAEYTKDFIEMQNGLYSELGAFDLTGILIVRGWMNDCFHNQPWDLYLTGPRASQYAMNNAENNVNLVSIVTERMTNDKDLEEYMLEKYPNPVEFKNKFKMERPTNVSRQIVHSMSGSNDGHYVSQGKLLIGVDAAENAYKILYGTDKTATDIRVLNQFGVQQDSGDVIDLTGMKTYIAVTAMPVYTDEKVEVTLSDNISDFVKYDYYDGSLTQTKETNVEYGTITFKTKNAEKTLKVKLKTDGYPIKFGWDFEEHDSVTVKKTDGDVKIILARNIGNRGDGYSNNRMMGSAVGVFEDGYYSSKAGSVIPAFYLETPVAADTNKNFAFKFKGVMNANTDGFDKSLLMFSKFLDRWGQLCDQAIRAEDERLVLCAYDDALRKEVELKAVDLNEFCDDTLKTAFDVRSTEAEWEIGLKNGVLYAKRNGKTVEFTGSGELPEILTIGGLFSNTVTSLDYIDIIYDYNDIIDHNADYVNGRAKWEINNYTGNKQPYNLLFGIYEKDTGRLVKTILADDSSVDYAGTKSGTTDLGMDSETQYAKSFLWESMQTLKPVNEIRKTPQKPEARNVEIISAHTGEPLSAKFDYYDLNNDGEGDSIYNWYISDSKDGGFEKVSTGKTFNVTADNMNKYIKLGVVPVSVNEPYEGDEVFSKVIGPVSLGYKLGISDTGTQRFLDVIFDNQFGLTGVEIDDYLPCIEYYDSENYLLGKQKFESGSYKWKTEKISLPVTQPEGTVSMKAYLYSAADNNKQLCDMLYYENIMRFKGLTANFLGDSITYGIGVSDKEKNRYDNIIAEKVGLKLVNNYGTSGSRIANQGDNDASSFNSRATGMSGDAGIIFVFGGTNDYGHGTAPFGTLADKTPDTYCGAVENLMTVLKNKYSDKTIVFLTPARRENDTVANSTTGKVLRDYCNVITAKGAEHGIPVLDLYNNLGIDPNNAEEKAAYTTDGLHFNDAGHKKIADLLINFIAGL